MLYGRLFDTIAHTLDLLSPLGLYDEIRHLLFVLPPISLLGTIGIVAGLRTAVGITRLIIGPISAACAILTLSEIIRIHPYQTVYINHTVAGTIDRT
ncbi:TPA: hypothetical protein DCE37_10630 [Candidatus Latescibacteria bacterium]|mgnify:CR=1 FL=1|nr:hypothetical protein [Candidatus Latescibacterota bacterium]